MSAYQYLFLARPLKETPNESESVSIACCVSNESLLRANLLSSPDLSAGSKHEILLAHNCTSAAEGLNSCIAHAKNRLVIAVHQDVYLPKGWFARVVAELRHAETLFGQIGVAGVYGIIGNNHHAQRAGRVVDRNRLLWEAPELPAIVNTLDELVLIVDRKHHIQFDPSLGFHFYGSDVCLDARRRGLASVVIDALCLHNSQSITLPDSFFSSSRTFVAKWARELPIITPTVRISADGKLQIW